MQKVIASQGAENKRLSPRWSIYSNSAQKNLANNAERGRKKVHPEDGEECGGTLSLGHAWPRTQELTAAEIKSTRSIIIPTSSRIGLGGLPKMGGGHEDGRGCFRRCRGM